MDTAPQWPQDVVVVKPMEPNPNSSAVERKMRAHKEQAFNCPRCNSINTKFCYYNNYSLSQPRFFCKACRRYWTQGGSLRNIPVGSGSKRNNKRSAMTTTSSSYHNNNDNNNFKKLPDLVPPHPQNPKTQDLDLQGSFIPAGFKSIFETTLESQNPNSSSSLSLPSSGVLYNNYEFMPFPIVGSVFHHLPEDHQINNKSSSSISFSLEHGGLESTYGDFQGLQENNSNSCSSKKLLFPFEDLKQDQDQDQDRNHDHRSSDRDQRTKGHDHQNGDPTNGFWNGVIGGESW